MMTHKPEGERPDAWAVELAVMLLGRELAWREWTAGGAKDIADTDEYAKDIFEALLQFSFGPDEVVDRALTQLGVTTDLENPEQRDLDELRRLQILAGPPKPAELTEEEWRKAYDVVVSWNSDYTTKDWLRLLLDLAGPDWVRGLIREENQALMEQQSFDELGLNALTESPGDILEAWKENGPGSREIRVKIVEDFCDEKWRRENK